MTSFRLIGLKSLRLAGVVLMVTALTFLMVNLLPGDVTHVIVGTEAGAGEIDALRRDLGLDRHPAVRYLHWLKGIAVGDLGQSYLTGEPVFEAILRRLPVTVELLIVSQMMALLLAVPAGIVGAYRNGTLWDRLINTTGFATLSIPSFVMALCTIYLFSIRLHWLPATGFTPLSQGVWANLRCFILPGLSIALIEWVVLMRALRSDMIATLQQNFILMARAKGLPAWKILLHHALRPSSFTLVTLLGLQIGRHMGEAVIVETLFALPGIGRLLINAIYDRDVMMVQGCILLITVTYVLINAAVDMGYALLDPRIREGGRDGV